MSQTGANIWEEIKPEIKYILLRMISIKEYVMMLQIAIKILK